MDSCNKKKTKNISFVSIVEEYFEVVNIKNKYLIHFVNFILGESSQIQNLFLVTFPLVGKSPFLTQIQI